MGDVDGSERIYFSRFACRFNRQIAKLLVFGPRAYSLSIRRCFRPTPEPLDISLSGRLMGACLDGRICLGLAMPGVNILLIEDDGTSREILEAVLSGAGYAVDLAETAFVARSRLRSNRYALVIADWLLPDGDGIYLADRAAVQGSRTLVITAHASDLPKGTAGRHHVLIKPTEPDALLALVRALIGEPQGQNRPSS